MHAIFPYSLLPLAQPGPMQEFYRNCVRVNTEQNECRLSQGMDINEHANHH